MGAETKIEWADMTFNPWRGCQKIAPGCKNCYAETLVNRFGDFGKRIRLADAGWREPLKWNKAAACNCNWSKGSASMFRLHAGHSVDFVHSVNCPQFGASRPRVFCASLADVFEDYDGDFPDDPPGVHGGVRCLLDHHGNRLCTKGGKIAAQWPDESGWRPYTMHDARDDLFALIDATPNLDWLLLTKRPANIRRMWPASGGSGPDREYGHCEPEFHRRNVWLLTSVSDQATADAAIPELLKCRDLAPVLGVSYEPALGPVDFTRLYNGCGETFDSLRNRVRLPGGRSFETSDSSRLDWIIYGGESGAHARPADVAWARSTVEQCRAAGVPVFVKQLGAWPTLNQFDGLPDWPDHVHYRANPGTNVLSLKDKKGGDWMEWPESLREREFPAIEKGGGA